MERRRLHTDLKSPAVAAAGGVYLYICVCLIGQRLTQDLSGLLCHRRSNPEDFCLIQSRQFEITYSKLFNISKELLTHDLIKSHKGFDK